MVPSRKKQVEQAAISQKELELGSWELIGGCVKKSSFLRFRDCLVWGQQRHREKPLPDRGSVNPYIKGGASTS